MVVPAAPAGRRHPSALCSGWSAKTRLWIASQRYASRGGSKAANAQPARKPRWVGKALPRHVHLQQPALGGEAELLGQPPRGRTVAVRPQMKLGGPSAPGQRGDLVEQPTAQTLAAMSGMHDYFGSQPPALVRAAGRGRRRSRLRRPDRRRARAAPRRCRRRLESGAATCVRRRATRRGRPLAPRLPAR